MSICPGHLREYIVRPVLRALDLYSESAEELLMLTAAQESQCGRWLHQVGGPALGIWQMEPATHDDCWTNFLAYRATLAAAVRKYGSSTADLPGNLYYACAMARVRYLRAPGALPSPADLNGLASYYKNHYNTAAGAATISEAIDSYNKFAQCDGA